MSGGGHAPHDDALSQPGARSIAAAATDPLEFSRPGKPTDNAFVESFNGHFREECLDQHWFVSLGEARQIIEAWRIDTTRSGRTGRWDSGHRRPWWKNC